MAFFKQRFGHNGFARFAVIDHKVHALVRVVGDGAKLAHAAVAARDIQKRRGGAAALIDGAGLGFYAAVIRRAPGIDRLVVLNGEAVHRVVGNDIDAVGANGKRVLNLFVFEPHQLCFAGFRVNKADVAGTRDEPDVAVKIRDRVGDERAGCKIGLHVIFLFNLPFRFAAGFVHIEDLDHVVGIADDRPVAA